MQDSENVYTFLLLSQNIACSFLISQRTPAPTNALFDRA